MAASLNDAIISWNPDSLFPTTIEGLRDFTSFSTESCLRSKEMKQIFIKNVLKAYALSSGQRAEEGDKALHAWAAEHFGTDVELTEKVFKQELESTRKAAEHAEGRSLASEHRLTHEKGC